MLKIAMVVVDKRSFNGFGSREFIIESESDIERVRKYANNKRKTKGIMNVELINEGVITQYRVCEIEKCLEDADDILNPDFIPSANITVYESVEAKENYIVVFSPYEKIILGLYSTPLKNIDKKIIDLIRMIDYKVEGGACIWANKWNCVNLCRTPYYNQQHIFEAIEDTSIMVGTFIIDNTITYQPKDNVFDGYEIIERYELEKAFNESDVWDLSLIEKLCVKAGMLHSYHICDGEGIEELIYKAAEKVDINIWLLK